MMKYLEALLISVVSVFMPIKAVLLTVLFLVFSDLILGVMAAKKEKQPITSAGLRRTISKLFIYEIVVISGFLAEKYLIQGLLPIVKLLGGLIGTVELKSILENANIIAGQNLFKVLVDKLGSPNQDAR